MNELNQIILATLGLLPSLGFAFTSAIGGRSFSPLGISARVWKRVIAPILFIICTLTLSLISGKFHLYALLSLPAYLFSCMVGYGSNTVWSKIARRTLWSLIRIAACLPLFMLTGNFTLLMLQLSFGIISTVILGVENPVSAPEEEFLINFISVLFVPYMVF